MFFISVLGIGAGLHNLGEAVRLLADALILKGGVELYVLLMLVSGVLALVGVWFMNMKKNSAAFLLTIAEGLCICEYLLGLKPSYAFSWSFCYAIAAAGSFYQVNLGLQIPNYRFRTRREVIETTIEQLSDTERIVKEQTVWIKKVDEFMKTYGVLTYYAFMALHCLCITTPILYFYRNMEHLPLENFFNDALKWSLLFFVIVVAGTEFQRRHLIDDNDRKN